MNNENLKPVKKGEIRNPLGKKAGTKNWKTIYKKFLEMELSPEEIKNTLNLDIPFIADIKEKLSIQEMIALRHLKKALKKCGTNDIKLIQDRVDGLLKQQIEQSGKIVLNISKDDEKIL